MSDVFGFIQKVILVTILAWLGVQFAPADKDDAEKEAANQESAITAFLR